jgi:hypothetical protein
MTNDWHFDANNPFENAFEETLLESLQTVDLTTAVMALLEHIRQMPERGELVRVGDTDVYVVHLPATVGRKSTTPPLVIAYALDAPRKLVRPLFVGSSEGLEHKSSLPPTLDAPHPSAASRAIRAPLHPTSIPKERIERAVTRALKRKRRNM